MLRNIFTKRIVMAAVLAAATGVGFAQTKPSDLLKPDTASTQPRVFNIPEVIANVGGDAITNGEFVQDLYLVSGPRVINDLIGVYSAREACRILGITVNEKEAMGRERDMLLTRLVASMSPPPDKELTMQQKDNLLMNFAIRQGVSPVELVWQFQQAGYLRAIGKTVKGDDGKLLTLVTAENINDEFQREFGQRADVRVYQFASMEAAAAFTKLAVASKEPFTTVAEDQKIHWDGVVVPLDPSVKFQPADFQPTLKELKEGEHSPFKEMEAQPGHKIWVILYVDKLYPKRVAADQEKTERDRIASLLLEAAQVEAGQQAVNKLRTENRLIVNINDPQLRQMMDAMQPATAPATGTGTPPK